MTVIRLYHGSDVAVPRPQFERCRPHNDYGQGFYCTQDIELARKWACQQGFDGFVSIYEVNLDELELVDLNASDFCILHWLAVLLEHRLCRSSTSTMQQGAAWLAQRYVVDLDGADIVKGYRADDSYFSFARAFLRNEITLDQLSRAMKLGNLGEQLMIKSPAGFEGLHYLDCEPVDSSVYWARREVREEGARAGFRDLLLEPALSSSTASRELSGPFDAPDALDAPNASHAPALFTGTLMDMGEGEIRACLS